MVQKKAHRIARQAQFHTGNVFANALALGELGSATGLLEAVLLALDDAGVAGEETSALEVGAVVASLEKGAGNAQTQGTGLTGDTATIAQGDDVKGTEGVGHLEGCLLYTSDAADE